MPYDANGTFTLLQQFGTGTDPGNTFPPQVGGVLDDVAAGLTAAKVVTPVLVANLPVGVAGLRSIVTNANSTAFGTVVAAGGANTVPVYFDGSQWRIG